MVIIFLLMLIWLICSAKFSSYFLLSGIISILFIKFISSMLAKKSSINSKNNDDSIPLPLFKIISKIKPFQLIIEMFISSFKVTKIIWLDYKNINPQTFLVEPTSKNKIDQIIEANSITLTPGTMSLSLENNSILVHAINNEFTKSLKDSINQDKNILMSKNNVNI